VKRSAFCAESVTEHVVCMDVTVTETVALLQLDILLRWLSSWSSVHAGGENIFRNLHHLPFFATRILNLWTNIRSWLWFPFIWASVYLLYQMTFENLPPFFGPWSFSYLRSPRELSLFFQRHSVFVQRFDSVCFRNYCSRTYLLNFLTSWDAPRFVYSLFN